MHVLRYESVDSTNEEAKRLLAEGRIVGPACLLAREQTAGKGTRGRSWSSPRDAGIYLTFVAPDPPGGGRAPTPVHTVAAGLACAEVLHEATGIDVRLKPVNDLVAAGGKLGGILCESTIRGGTMTDILVGVGINVRAVERGVAAPGLSPVSLEDLLPDARLARLDVEALAVRVAAAVGAWIEAVDAGAVERLRDGWSRFGAAGAACPLPEDRG